MRRFLILGGFLALGTLLVVLSFVFRSDRTGGEDMVWARGRTPAGSATGDYNQGLASQTPGSPRAGTWTGELVDAGCSDRTREALGGEPGRAIPGGGPETQGSADRVAGVDRSDAMAQQVPDATSRQADSGCAVTGATRALALYLPNGELVNLDEGGNTKVMDWFQGTADGTSVLEGRTRGAKPRVTITGKAEGDRIVLDSVGPAR